MSFLKWLFSNKDEQEEMLKQDEINKLPDPPEGFEDEEEEIEKVSIDVDGSYRFKVVKDEENNYHEVDRYRYYYSTHKVIVTYSAGVTYNDYTINLSNDFDLNYSRSEEHAYAYVLTQLNEGEEFMESFKAQIKHDLEEYLRVKDIESMKKIINGDSPLEIKFSFEVPKEGRFSRG